jgi:hypothetical protein
VVNTLLAKSAVDGHAVVTLKGGDLTATGLEPASSAAFTWAGDRGDRQLRRRPRPGDRHAHQQDQRGGSQDQPAAMSTVGEGR